VLKYFFSFKIFEQITLALKTEFALKFFTVLQARSQVLRFGGAKYIFRGEIFLFYCMIRNYFINFQRLTEQHIASCLFSV